MGTMCSMSRGVEGLAIQHAEVGDRPSPSHPYLLAHDVNAGQPV